MVDDVQDDDRAAQVAYGRGVLRELEAQNKRLSDALAERSRELGEALRRAEKAEEYGRAADRRFEMQRKGLIDLQRQIGEAKGALATGR